MRCSWFLVFMTGLCWAAEPWIPHYTAETGGFATTLHLINGDYENDFVAKITAYDAGGLLLADAAREVTVPAGQRLDLTRDALQWNGVAVSHLRISAGDNVKVSASYQTTGGSVLPATVSAQESLTASVRFLPVNQSGAFDGLVLVNPGEEPLTFQLSAHDPSGNTGETLRFTLAPKAKWVAVPANLFSENVAGDGFIAARAPAGLVAMGLRGTLPGSGVSVLTELALDRNLPAAAKLTYSNQISRIINRKCATCHQNGGIGPFPLTNYSETVTYPDLMQLEVSEGRMPPWKASTECSEFKGVQALDPAEKDMLLAWLAADLDQGPPQRAPIFEPAGDIAWRGGTPTQTFTYNEAYEFKPGPDDYRCFPIPLNNRETLYLEGLEILPGSLEFVHHVILYAVTTNEGEALDLSESGPGYTCFGGPETEEVRMLGGWAPGSDPQFFGDNIGMRIEPNTTIVMQVHYHYSGTAGFDQTQFGLYLSETPHEKELFLLPLLNEDFVIPAGASDYVVSESLTLPNFVWLDLFVVMPHMHLLGKSVTVSTTDNAGGEQCLIDIPKWDFNWQKFYSYQDAVRIEPGSTITLNCVFDNSAQNPYNPNNPPLPVRWGDATTDEMALAFIGVVAPFDITDEKSRWEWPMKVNAAGVNLEKRRTNPLNKLPSCCRKGDAVKPWKKCDAGTTPLEPKPR
ncbi:monooxygenase [Acanthopleuribacter pedis]|uniref:Copper type II ascorbate-dependent monooxygenase C-terminal domain-containing protein n=1 Tax=Acanthopleuribacter pedis TaxID=442870 RepID=A0A8J7PZM8_9BACT|nr:hypothetical protein [Acanthopleuribacter pedis]MBO1317677.1 hypothetical protein [Acanthopleuribacter pedis]